MSGFGGQLLNFDIPFLGNFGNIFSNQLIYIPAGIIGVLISFFIIKNLKGKLGNFSSRKYYGNNLEKQSGLKKVKNFAHFTKRIRFKRSNKRFIKDLIKHWELYEKHAKKNIKFSENFSKDAKKSYGKIISILRNFQGMRFSVRYPFQKISKSFFGRDVKSLKNEYVRAVLIASKHVYINFLKEFHQKFNETSKEDPYYLTTFFVKKNLIVCEMVEFTELVIDSVIFAVYLDTVEFSDETKNHDFKNSILNLKNNLGLDSNFLKQELTHSLASFNKVKTNNGWNKDYENVLSEEFVKKIKKNNDSSYELVNELIDNIKKVYASFEHNIASEVSFLISNKSMEESYNNNFTEIFENRILKSLLLKTEGIKKENKEIIQVLLNDLKKNKNIKDFKKHKKLLEDLLKEAKAQKIKYFEPVPEKFESKVISSVGSLGSTVKNTEK